MARRGRPDLNRVALLRRDSESKARLTRELWRIGRDVEFIRRVTGLSRREVLAIIYEFITHNPGE